MGWDEIATSGLDTDRTVVMWWRHDKPQVLDRILARGYKTVLCPRIPMYFDFVQHDSHKSGRRWDGFSDLQSVYEFPSGLDIEAMANGHVLGIQANLWTERIQDKKWLDFMVWPRLSAMAEAGWTNAANKSYRSFQKRLKKMLTIFDQYGIYYFNPFDLKETPEPIGPHTERWQMNHN